MKLSLAQLQPHLLVVEDDQITRHLVRSIVRAMGITEIIIAEDGREALIMVAEKHVDLIICDWNLPYVSGLEVLETLRADPKSQHLPFIMLTAETFRGRVAAAMKAGVSDYLVKPFTAQALTAKVEALVVKIASRYEIDDLC